MSNRIRWMNCSTLRNLFSRYNYIHDIYLWPIKQIIWIIAVLWFWEYVELRTEFFGAHSNHHHAIHYLLFTVHWLYIQLKALILNAFFSFFAFHFPFTHSFNSFNLVFGHTITSTFRHSWTPFIAVHCLKMVFTKLQRGNCYFKKKKPITSSLEIRNEMLKIKVDNNCEFITFFAQFKNVQLLY